MAVYKRTYSAYTGPLTAPRWRFLVVARYALAHVAAQRLFIGLMMLAFLPVLAMAVTIYLGNSEKLRMLLEMQNANIINIDATFFLYFLRAQFFVTLLLAAWVTPTLISRDVSHNALPLYFSRPFSKAEYTLGKLTAILLVLSLVTWVPGLLLYLMQVGMAPAGWFTSNLRVGFAVFAGGLLWSVFLGFIALAVSAWVRWRILGGFMLLVAVIAPGAFGEVINEVLRTRAGNLLDVIDLISSVWAWLFGLPPHPILGPDRVVPVALPLAILGMGMLAATFMLHKRLQPREVVRG